MRKAEQRGWTKKSAPCYVEEHHVFIRAVFGENDRVVCLTAREHVLAHLLLFKACLKKYGRHDWRTWKVAEAATAMGMLSKHTWQRTAVTCSTLGLARKVAAENKSIAYKGIPQGPKPGSARPGESNHFFGKTHTEETCALISEQGLGRVWWWYPRTGETTTSKKCPGKGWERGRPATGPQKNPSPDQGSWMLGSKNHKSRAIYLRHTEWEGEKYYESALQASKEYNLTNSKLLATAHGKSKQHKGFVARFA
jgi:hypothetical protein